MCQVDIGNTVLCDIVQVLYTKNEQDTNNLLEQGWRVINAAVAPRDPNAPREDICAHYIIGRPRGISDRLKV